MATEDDVRRIALELPETTEQLSYGTPGFRVKDKLFARIRERDPVVLVAWVASIEEKEALIASEPETFFTRPHYDGHASVLVRVERIPLDELREVLADAWLARAPQRVRAAFEAGP